jgi:type IV secretory pathway VirB4 component
MSLLTRKQTLHTGSVVTPFQFQRESKRHAPLPQLPRGRATTAQASVLYPFMAGASLGAQGIYLGDDQLAGGGAWCFDPFDAYQRQIISSPNMLVMGQLGYGKSAFIKTFLARSVGLLAGRNGQPRRCAILDPKGEYKALGEMLGLTYVKLQPGGTCRVNPLDAGTQTGESLEAIAERRMTLLTALASDVAAKSNRRLTPMERSVLAWVCTLLTERQGTGHPPTLRDVVHLLENPTEEMAARARRTEDEFVRATEDLRFSIIELLDGPLRGMFDGQSNVFVDWAGRGVVVDLSAVKDHEAALSVVMTCASSWLDSVLTAGAAVGDGSVWYQVLDEGWALIGSEDRVAHFQSKQKLARHYGVVNMLVIHRISDLMAQADDGSKAAKIGKGLLSDSQTRVIFHQDRDQIGNTADMLGLTGVEEAWLPQLPKGRALWKVGAHTALVQGRVAPSEWSFASTDSSMAA